MFSASNNSGLQARFSPWLVLALVLGSMPGQAIDLGSDLQLHGFATQGYVKTTDNRWFGDSNSSGGSFDFTELVVNASYKATSSVLLSGQILSRRAGDMYDGSPTVDYALVD